MCLTETTIFSDFPQISGLINLSIMIIIIVTATLLVVTEVPSCVIRKQYFFVLEMQQCHYRWLWLCVIVKYYAC